MEFLPVQYVECHSCYLDIRGEKEEGNSPRCCKPQSLDVGDCSGVKSINSLMFFGFNNRQICAVTLASLWC